MKKTVIASLIGTVLMGAAVSANAAIEQNQLTIWLNGDKGYNGLAKIAEEFTKATGIKVTVAHPDQVEEKFMQTAATQDGPDIIMWAHDRFGEWAKAGLLAPLNPSKEEKAKFADFAWDAVTADGKIVGYPVAIEAVGLICNNKLVPTPPENFEDFKKLDEELQKKDKDTHAILWDYNTPYFSYPIVAADGGYAFKRTETGYDVKDTGVANDGAKAGVNWIVDMIKTGHMAKGADFGVMEAQFAKGKLGCIINGPWAWANYDKAKIDFSVNALPALNGKPAKPFVGVLSAGVNAASPNKELAVEFLEKYFLTDKGLKAMNDDKQIGVSALNSFEKQLARNPRIAATMDNAMNGEPMPNVPEMSRFWSSFQTALQNATSGRQSVNDALEQAAKRIVADK